MHNRGPEFIVAGAPKAGTTALINLLNESPDVDCITHLPNGQEPHFFSKGYHLGLQYYQTLFEKLDSNKIIGEKSVSYMTDKNAALRIHNHFPGVKLLFVLRNPIDRAYSQYKANVQRGTEYLSFKKAIRHEKLRTKVFKNNYSYLERGYYARMLENYYNLFPKHQIHITIYEKFAVDPEGCIKEICTFLGVDDSFIRNLDFNKKYNESIRPKFKFPQFFVMLYRKYSPLSLRKGFFNKAISKIESSNKINKPFPKIDLRVRQELMKMYNTPNEQLQKMTGADLSLWKLE